MQHDEKDIKFLIRENKQLKEEIQELRDLIRVNKQSIDILSNSRPQNGREKVNATMDVASIHSGRSREEARLLDVIKMLNNQNGDLMAELEAVKQQNDELNTKVRLHRRRCCCSSRSRTPRRSTSSELCWNWSRRSSRSTARS